MATYKTVDADLLDGALSASADAIRAKTGGADMIPFDMATATGFAEAISAISAGGGFSSPYLVKVSEITVASDIANCNDIYYGGYLGYTQGEDTDGKGLQSLFVIIVHNPDPAVENAGVSFMTQNMVAHAWSSNSQVIYSRYTGGALKALSHPASYTSTALFVVPAGAKMTLFKFNIFGEE